MTRVIENIIQNAFEASEGIRGAEVQVKCEHLDDKLQLSISNNGPAIPPDKIDKIFAHGFTSGKKDETDFGLSIVKELIKKNNGDIKVESSEARTSFIIRLPLRN